MRRLSIDPDTRRADLPDDQPTADAGRRWLQRGQVMAIFAGALVALMMLMAMVVDLGWYWSSGLKIQRAADAAALAGAVYLPENFNGALPNAQSAALAAAQRNGYVPDTDTSLTSAVDGNNPRQLNVTITDKVGTFFLKVVGIPTLNASRSSKAEFVLPVPMGSPQNYYGVGTFLNQVTPQIITRYTNPSNYNPANQTTGISPTVNTQSHATGGAWTNPDRAYASDGSFATSSTNLNQTVWRTFNFGSFQSGAIFDGVVINLQAKVSTGATCQIRTEVSSDGGSNWGSTARSMNLTGSNVWSALGSSTDPTAWGSNLDPWASGDFSSTLFQVRLTYVRPSGCGTVSLDEITAVVYSHTLTYGAPVDTVQTVNGPTGSSLASQGFWGAVITKGGSRENGDQFAPAKDNLKSTSNPDFDGKGVDYSVLIAGSGGQVQLYDPTFCATGSEGPGKGNYGAGDHWIGGAPNGVTTIYSLFDQNGTPYDISDDGPAKATSGNLFAGEIQADYSGDFGSPPANLSDCSNATYHNKWYQLASGLPAGSYRLNVSTNVAGNDSTNAENMWSAWVSSSSAGSQVFGQGKMVTYNNLVAGQQLFYLAQIDKVHAGKTMEIKLFDPGDVSGDAFLSIKSPDGNAYNYVDFTYSADNGRSGASSGPNKSIQTASTSGGSFYQDSLITIEIPLPVTYGSVGLTPPGEPGAGWWKIEYTVAGGNDTTTWQVDIQGNPVHLLTP